MGMPYRARINERTLLNLPGFHGGAFVYVYVEDTSERELVGGPYCDADCSCCPCELRAADGLEIADCNRRIGLEFDVDTREGRENSLHKLDTLEIAIRVFRDALVAEFEPYDRRERSSSRSVSEPAAPGGRGGRPPAGVAQRRRTGLRSRGATPTEGSNPSIRIGSVAKHSRRRQHPSFRRTRPRAPATGRSACQGGRRTMPASGRSWTGSPCLQVA